MSHAHLRNNRLNEIIKAGVKILAVAGASGGHIFPALGFLDTLKVKYKNIETLLLFPKRNIIGKINTFDYKVNYISISSIKLSIDFKNFVDILLFFKGSWESLFILFKFRPDIVVGFGSLASIPAVMFAWLFRIKILIHEQNVIPGQANLFLAKFSDRIAISFAKTRDYFQDYSRKIVLTGNPVRKVLSRIDKDKALDFFGFNNDKFTILVMGGSQGSHRINIRFLETISMISNKPGLQIIHLTGTKDCDLLKLKYKDLNINVRLFNFLSSMQYAYSACDLVVSRAGATAITEIIFFRLPAILIPYPYAYKHQIANAKALENIGSAIIIEDHGLDTGILKRTLEDLINSPDRLKEMRVHYDNTFRPNANDLLVEAVLSLN